MIASQSVASYPRIAAVIAGGGIIAFRTDTFYGLGADPFNGAAVRRIRELKGREDRNPILIVVSDRDQVNRFVAKQSAAFGLLADKFWPGPLTLIGDATPSLPDQITLGTETVGVRFPGDDEVCALVRACGGALTATSVNLAGGPPARKASAVSDYFPNGIDVIVDGGEVNAKLPSTVIDLTVAPPRLIREGEVARPDIERALATIQTVLA